MSAGAALSPAVPSWAPPAFGASSWPFRLLLLFLFLLMANAALLVPGLEPLAPAQWVAVAALALLFLECSLSRRPLRMAWPESHLLVGFLAVTIISSLSALWMHHALENGMVLLKFVTVYLLIVNTVDSYPRLRLALSVLAAGGLFPALGAIAHARGGKLVEGDRAGWIGIFANPNDLAFALVLLLPPVIALALGARGAIRIAWAAAAALYAVALFLTYSRGGMLAFGFVLVLCLLRFCSPRAGIVWLSVLAAFVAVVLPVLWSRSEGFGDLLGDVTVQQRLITVQTGLRMFADRPLLGVGLGCSSIGWPLYAPPEAAAGRWLHSHNTFVQLLAETGAIGTCLFLAAFVAALAKARRLASRWRRLGNPDIHRTVASLEISLLGFLACSLSGGFLLSWFPYLVLGLVSTLPFSCPTPPARRRAVPAAVPPQGGW